MECTVPVEVHLLLEHADVGSLERAVTDALARVGQALWAARIERPCFSPESMVRIDAIPTKDGVGAADGELAT